MDLHLPFGLAPCAARPAAKNVTLVDLIWVHASLAKRLDRLRQRRCEGPHAPAGPPPRSSEGNRPGSGEGMDPKERRTYE